MIQPEAQQVATAITMIRPDWPYASLMTLLGRHKHRTARDVMLALTWIAYDPETKTPGRIDADGPWWATSRLAGVEPTLPPYYDRKPIERDPDARPADPEEIQAMKDQIRASREAS